MKGADPGPHGIAAVPAGRAAGRSDPAALASRVLEGAGSGRPLTLALDYDGTLVPLAPRPGEARAEPSLAVLLGALAALPATAVAVVSGRGLDDLRSVLGAPEGVALFAEHGGVGFLPPDPPFPVFIGDTRPLTRARSEAVGITWPEGTWIEEKELTLALHTRGADRGHAGDARERFRALFARAGPAVQLLEGHEILEARPSGLHKGLAVTRLRRAPWSPGALMVYAGDDRTDEDALGALGPDDVGIRVGSAPATTAAGYLLSGPGELRVFLERILAGPRTRALGGVR